MSITFEHDTAEEVAHMTETFQTTDWRHRAACRTEDPELFFPVGNGPAAQAQAAKAKAVCADCPVRAECLAFALATGVDGVYGGLDEHERRALKLRRRVSA